MSKKKVVKPKKETKPRKPEQRQKRRAAHWRRTGVSEATIRWMQGGDML